LSDKLCGSIRIDIQENDTAALANIWFGLCLSAEQQPFRPAVAGPVGCFSRGEQSGKDTKYFKFAPSSSTTLGSTQIPELLPRRYPPDSAVMGRRQGRSPSRPSD